MGAALPRFVRAAVEHPVITVFLVALVSRLAFAIASNFLHDGPLIPDEEQYLVVAQWAADGELTGSTWAGYAQSLFDSTRVFMWPLTALFWLFGPSRLVALLLPVLFGAVTAAAATALARHLLRRPYALGAGLMVALFPSQILWSSVVLRESLIWALLAVMALLVVVSQRKESTTGILWSVVAVALLFVALTWGRDQTAALALWCVVPALVLGRSRRGFRILCVAGLFLIAPWTVGMGPGGVVFIDNVLERLGTTQGYMSMTADSSFRSFEIIPTEVSPVESFDTSSDCMEYELRLEAGGLGDQQSELAKQPSGEWDCVRDGDGDLLLVDNRLTTSFEGLPRGLYHTMIRPLPWESTATWGLKAAGFESPLWIIAYGLAGYGVWSLRRRFRQIAFPVLIFLAVSLSGAVTHGNLGTAFRHRGQVFFALALLVMAGVQALSGRRGGARSNPPDSGRGSEWV